MEDARTTALTEDRGFDDEDLALLHQSNSMVIKTHSASAEQSNKTQRSKKSAKNRATAHYIDDTAAPYLPLPAGQINIKRMVNANIAEPSKQRITGEYSSLVLVKYWSFSVIAGLGIMLLTCHIICPLMFSGGLPPQWRSASGRRRGQVHAFLQD